MKLEQINIQLRPRTSWEALDLGRVMLLAWHNDAWRAWSITYFAFGVPLLLLLWKYQTLALLLIWWLKPLCDRALLFSFSRSLFGTSTATQDVWRSLPVLLKNTGLFSALTLRRFSMVRSFLLPVWQLEDQKGASAQQRCEVLSGRVRGYAVWLTLFCSYMSCILWISLIFVIEILIPEGRQVTFGISDLMHGQMSAGTRLIPSFMYLAAESIVEPFYVASGFALYLNRRSELEGWDIELAFRHMSSRKAEE